MTDRDFVNRSPFKLDLVRYLDSDYEDAERALHAAPKAIARQLGTSEGAGTR